MISIHCVAGNGSQFITLCISIIVMALLGMFNVHRHHSMNSTALLLYAFTSCVAGYISSNFFKKIGGHNWVWNIILTSSLFAIPFFFVWSVVNTVAWIYHSTQALPFTTIILIMLIWLLGTCASCDHAHMASRHACAQLHVCMYGRACVQTSMCMPPPFLCFQFCLFLLERVLLLHTHIHAHSHTCVYAYTCTCTYICT